MLWDGCAPHAAPAPIHARSCDTAKEAAAAVVTDIEEHLVERWRPLAVVRIDLGLWRWVASFLSILLASLLALFDTHYQGLHGHVSPEVWTQWRRTNQATVWFYVLAAIGAVWVGRLRWIAVGFLALAAVLFLLALAAGTV